MGALNRHTVLLVLLAASAAGASAQLVPNLGGQRAGISTFQFLKIGVGARGVAMGESFVACANDVSALYWNPAALVQFAQDQAIAAHTEYLADIKHEFFGIAWHLSAQDALGASFTSLHMKDMEITTETQPFGTGRYFSFGDIAAALSYSRKMTDQFSFGATVKYVEETLDVLKMRSVMVDIGTWYWTGLGSTRFAVTISNFGSDVAPKGTVTQFDGTQISSFQSFSVPTEFRLAVALEPLETEGHVLTTSLQLNHPNDNAENVRLGLEYSFQKTLFLRAGIKRTIGQKFLGADLTSEESYAAGAGVLVPIGLSDIGADYAFAYYGRLGAVHRINLSFTL
ncbi:MAG TPA: PorV/PorQ family protein [Bacteroidota bacterium]|nr:PorV/PorQ family protein [Bacteroidota bacterium]